MGKSDFAKRQISYALNSVWTGAPVANVIRNMANKDQMFYRDRTSMADRVGFEPTVGFHLRRFSRPLP